MTKEQIFLTACENGTLEARKFCMADLVTGVKIPYQVLQYETYIKGLVFLPTKDQSRIVNLVEKNGRPVLARRLDNFLSGKEENAIEFGELDFSDLDDIEFDLEEGDFDMEAGWDVEDSCGCPACQHNRGGMPTDSTVPTTIGYQITVVGANVHMQPVFAPPPGPIKSVREGFWRIERELDFRTPPSRLDYLLNDNLDKATNEELQQLLRREESQNRFENCQRIVEEINNRK